MNSHARQHRLPTPPLQRPQSYYIDYIEMYAGLEGGNDNQAPHLRCHRCGDQTLILVHGASLPGSSQGWMGWMGWMRY